MKKYERRLVKYVMGCEKEMQINLLPDEKPLKLVLVSHDESDEMTAQANEA